MICKVLWKRGRIKCWYRENREKIIHSKKIYYTENKKVKNKKEDCDRNVFTPLSRCVKEQKSSRKKPLQ